MQRVRVSLSISVLALMSGCAHLPDGTIGYYLPTSKVSFTVVRTIGCDQAHNLISASAVTPTVVHSADPSARRVIDMSKLRGELSDADVKLTFYDDGRLSAVNATSTGQGEAVLKTAVAIAAAAIKGPAAGFVDPRAVCAKIKKFGGDKPLTLTYEGDVDLTKVTPHVQPLAPKAESEFYAAQLSSIGGYNVEVVEHRTPAKPLDLAKGGGDVTLAVRQPGQVHIRVTGAGSSTPVWDDWLTVANFGTEYPLALPSPTLFGKKTLAATFAESGALTSLQYASETGAGGVANVVSAVADATKGKTAADKAADVKAQADLIAEQQRLVACRIDATTCK